MSTIEEKLAKSLTASTTELIPYLSYLLQDLWDLGSSPHDMLDLIKKHIVTSKQTKILDLACGKGAVSVFLAKHLSCHVKGIDIMPDFITYANQKADAYHVRALCDFVVSDINEAILYERDYDIVILGAVGDVLGSPFETIEKLKRTIKHQGFILIDDAYGKEGIENDGYTKKDWLRIFEDTSVRLIEDKIIDNEDVVNLNQSQQQAIIKRANELKMKYPEKIHLFDDYIKDQQAECEELENEVLGVTMLLQTDK